MKGKGGERIEVGDWQDLSKRFPKQWVAIEITETTPGIGFTRGVLIARGSRRMEARVVEKLDKFTAANPDKQFGLFYTGPLIKLGEDVILSPMG